MGALLLGAVLCFCGIRTVESEVVPLTSTNNLSCSCFDLWCDFDMFALSLKKARKLEVLGLNFRDYNLF